MSQSRLDSQSGFMVVATVMIIIIMIPIYILISSRFSTSLVEARTSSTQKMMISEAVSNIAVIVRSAYVRAKTVGCSNGIQILTPHQNGNGQVSLCLPDDPSVTNRVVPNNPFLINSGNALLTASNPNRFDLREAFDKFVRHLPFLEFSFLPRAKAGLQQISSQPPIPAYAPIVRPTTSPAVRICDGKDLVCLTVRLCQKKSHCSDDEAFYQRFGFRP